MKELAQELLRVDGLQVQFETKKGPLVCVEDICFSINRGETVALVGESGCGKSVTSMSIMHLLASNGSIGAGKVIFDGEDITHYGEAEMNKLRGAKMSMIFQEPMTSLNPLLKIGYQITEVLKLHTDNSAKENEAIAMVLLKEVGIPDPKKIMKSYPHELSGGMRQRVMIAIALACNPALLIADEPTTALDVTIQAQILELIKELRTKHDAAILLITHDLGVVAEMADYVVVMYCGQIVERAPVFELFENYKHPYTKGLLAAVPHLDMAADQSLNPIPGTVPGLSEIEPNQCRFANRCPYATEQCRTQAPGMVEVAPDHLVRCHLVTGGNDHE